MKWIWLKSTYLSVGLFFLLTSANIYIIVKKNEIESLCENGVSGTGNVFVFDQQPYTSAIQNWTFWVEICSVLFIRPFSFKIRPFWLKIMSIYNRNYTE